jgi:hypothetical protein
MGKEEGEKVLTVLVPGRSRYIRMLPSMARLRDEREHGVEYEQAQTRDEHDEHPDVQEPAPRKQGRRAPFPVGS